MMGFLGSIRYKGKRIKIETRLGWIRRGLCEDEDEFFISLKDERDGHRYDFNKHELSSVSELDEASA